MLNRIKNLNLLRTFPLILLLSGGLAYSIYLTKLGFYWDEWPFLWFQHTFDAPGVLEYFQQYRPFWGYLYTVTLPLLGTNPIVWQLFGLITRWLCALAIWWALSRIWPERKNVTAAVALLWMVYPSFMEQSIALMYGHFFIVLSCYFLSIGFMVGWIRSEKWLHWQLIPALLFSAVNLFCMEYFFGLELARPVIIWLLVSQRANGFRDRIKLSLRHYLPFFLVLVGYVYWRVAVFQFPTYQPGGLDFSNPLQAVAKLASSAFTHMVTTTLGAWQRVFWPPVPSDFGPKSMLVYTVLIIFSLVVITGFFLLVNQKNQKRDSSVALLGLVYLLLAGAPFLVTGLWVDLNYPADRFTLPYMIGGSLLLVGCLDLISWKRWLPVFLLGTFASGAIGLQFMNASRFQQDWTRQRDLFWQLSWRAPNIQPHTVILTEELPNSYVSDNSLTAPLNWMYAPDYHRGGLPYLMSFLSVRVPNGTIKLQSDQPIHQYYQVSDFNGNTSQAIVMYYNPPACLRILDPERDKSFPMLPDWIRQAVFLSNPQMIEMDTENPAQPMDFLGKEPAHGWCYYFEKADLARANEDWKQVADLGDQALAGGDYPNEPGERIVFVEGFAHTGRWAGSPGTNSQSIQGEPDVG